MEVLGPSEGLVGTTSKGVGARTVGFGCGAFGPTCAGSAGNVIAGADELLSMRPTAPVTAPESPLPTARTPACVHVLVIRVTASLNSLPALACATA